jgi:hypothetical protein
MQHRRKHAPDERLLLGRDAAHSARFQHSRQVVCVRFAGNLKAAALVEVVELLHAAQLQLLLHVFGQLEDVVEDVVGALALLYASDTTTFEQVRSYSRADNAKALVEANLNKLSESRAVVVEKCLSVSKRLQNGTRLNDSLANVHSARSASASASSLEMCAHVDEEVENDFCGLSLAGAGFARDENRLINAVSLHALECVFCNRVDVRRKLSNLLVLVLCKKYKNAISASESSLEKVAGHTFHQIDSVQILEQLVWIESNQNRSSICINDASVVSMQYIM